MQLLRCVGEYYGIYGVKPLVIIVFDHFTPYEDPIWGESPGGIPVNDIDVQKSKTMCQTYLKGTTAAQDCMFVISWTLMTMKQFPMHSPIGPLNCHSLTFITQPQSSH